MARVEREERDADGSDDLYIPFTEGPLRPGTGKLTRRVQQYTRDSQTQTCARALQPSHDYDALEQPLPFLLTSSEGGFFCHPSH